MHVMQFLLAMPQFLLALLVLGIAVAISTSCALLVRRCIPVQSLRAHNDIAGPIFGTIGVIYAVLLAFVVIVSWQNFDRAQMNDAGEYRRQRLVDAQTGIHPMLWTILIAGGAITIVFTSFFGSGNLGVHLIMSNMLAILIALALLTIVVLDYPFTGSVSIQPDAFQQVIANISGT